jgi:hypothetical protein
MRYALLISVPRRKELTNRMLRRMERGVNEYGLVPNPANNPTMIKRAT